MSQGIPCIGSVAGVRAVLEAARREGRTVGLVPTMGALHEGHLSLIRQARADNDLIVVSIFVNPTQFGAGEDLESYPRDVERDLRLAGEAGADVVFSPSEAQMYPRGYSTWVDVEGLTEGLCGSSRPGHFRGVCTVVTKLFAICGPDRAYFGEKDAQQLAVIKRMVQDLNTPVEVVSCPTVREADGLALSSRNVRLSDEERAEAPVIFRALSAARTLVENGEREAARLEDEIRTVLADASRVTIDYVEIVDAVGLTPVEVLAGPCLVAVAVWFGDTRLIDNLTVVV